MYASGGCLNFILVWSPVFPPRKSVINGVGTRDRRSRCIGHSMVRRRQTYPGIQASLVKPTAKVAGPTAATDVMAETDQDVILEEANGDAAEEQRRSTASPRRGHQADCRRGLVYGTSLERSQI